MKNILILIILSISGIAYAQTPFDILSSHEDKPAALSASSQHNPWVGAKLAYNVSGDVSDAFLLSARVLYVAASGDRYAFPIVGNVGLNNAESRDNGVSIGVFPYYTLSSKGSMQLLLHGGLNYHILDKKNVSAQNEFSILAGFEAAFYPADGGSPATFAIAPEYLISTGLVNSNSLGINLTGILPIANGLGALIEGQIPVNNSIKTGVRIGVIVNSAIR